MSNRFNIKRNSTQTGIALAVALGFQLIGDATMGTAMDIVSMAMPAGVAIWNLFFSGEEK